MYNFLLERVCALQCFESARVPIEPQPNFALFATFLEPDLCNVQNGLINKRIREVLGTGTGKRVFEKLEEIREVLERKGVLAEVEPKLKAAEKEMEIYRDQLLHAAVPASLLG